MSVDNICSNVDAFLFFRLVTTKFHAGTSWSREIFFSEKKNVWNVPFYLENDEIFFEHNFANCENVQNSSFVSKSHLFASIRKFTVFGQNSARTANKLTFWTASAYFVISTWYSKTLYLWRYKSQKEKIYRRVTTRAKRTTRSFRTTLALALNELTDWASEQSRRQATNRQRLDILFSNQTARDHVLERDSFSTRLRSAGVRLCVLLWLAGWRRLAVGGRCFKTFFGRLQIYRLMVLGST